MFVTRIGGGGCQNYNKQVNAATNTVGMQKTGLQLVPLIIAGLMLLGGLMAPRRIK